MVLNTIAGPAAALQPHIAKAAKVAGAQLFVLSDYGNSTEGYTERRFGLKEGMKNLLRDELNLPYATFYVGAITDFFFTYVFYLIIWSFELIRVRKKICSKIWVWFHKRKIWDPGEWWSGELIYGKSWHRQVCCTRSLLFYKARARMARFQDRRGPNCEYGVMSFRLYPSYAKLLDGKSHGIRYLRNGSCGLGERPK